MSNRTPQTFTDAIIKFLSIKMTTKLAVKRSWDDWTWKQMWANKKRQLVRNLHKIDLGAHSKSGSDIAVAKFVIDTCQGRIMTERRQKWTNLKTSIPSEYSRDFRVTAIDLEGRNLITESIDNLVGLDELRYLNLSRNDRLDDFACDQLARQYRSSRTLREIDLSYNPFITVYGLEVLFRIPSIKRITAINTRASKYEQIDLFTMAAKDERDCDIFVHQGRQYLDEDLENLRLGPEQQNIIDDDAGGQHKALN